jgi:hypothetical protein
MNHPTTPGALSVEATADIVIDASGNVVKSRSHPTVTDAFCGYCILVEGPVPFILAESETGRPLGFDTRCDAAIEARDHEAITGQPCRIIPLATNAHHGAKEHNAEVHAKGVESMRAMFKNIGATTEQECWDALFLGAAEMKKRKAARS